MGIVLDVNIIKNYYDETVIGKSHSLTESAKKILENEDSAYEIFTDEGGNIVHEWGGPVDQDWFNEWYTSRLISGQIRIIPVCNCPTLCKSLYGLGFPKGGRDIWYIRTAKESLKYQKKCFLITEDIDFYNPKQKNKLKGVSRIKCIKSRNAPIRKFLLTNEKICVMCVKEFVSNK